MVREVTKDELYALLELYLFLHEQCIPEQNEQLEKNMDSDFAR